MAWSAIRKATMADRQAMEIAALRFCKRHGIDPDISAVEAIENELNPGNGCTYSAEDRARRLRPLWRRIVRRALGSNSAEGIAYGCVGFNVD